jgi:gas vesicle protein
MNAKKLIGGLLAGVALGVAIGMLLAPSSGEVTRSRIAKGSRKLTDDLKESLDDSIDSVKSKFNFGLEELERRGKDVLTDGKRA